MELKERLAALRRERGLTQDELARAVGVTRQAVSKWERGVIAPSTVNLVALGRLYGVPLDELANGEPPPKEPAAVAVAEKPEEPPKETGRLRLAGAAVLAVCLLLVTVASVITIGSAIFKEPEEPENTAKFVWQDELQGEDIDPAEVIYDIENTGIIFNYEP